MKILDKETVGSDFVIWDHIFTANINLGIFVEYK